jgi:hypothetical protein
MLADQSRCKALMSSNPTLQCRGSKSEFPGH